MIVRRQAHGATKIYVGASAAAGLAVGVLAVPAVAAAVGVVAVMLIVVAWWGT